MESLIDLSAMTASQTECPAWLERPQRACTSATYVIPPSFTNCPAVRISLPQARKPRVSFKGMLSLSTMSRMLCISCVLLQNMFQFRRTRPSAAQARIVVTFSGIRGSAQFCSTVVMVRVSTALSQVPSISMPIFMVLENSSEMTSVDMKPVDRCLIRMPIANPVLVASATLVMAFTKLLVRFGRLKISPKSPWTSLWSCWPKRYHSKSCRNIAEKTSVLSLWAMRVKALRFSLSPASVSRTFTPEMSKDARNFSMTSATAKTGCRKVSSASAL
mmetsp:Transcript_17934/g.40584  ORF Transcript_17934/g.40584 Transcript_17934/m.40584 type:complete len:274 (+) Transcript_17934:385-1206(+)